jgi:hypothetical protein
LPIVDWKLLLDNPKGSDLTIPYNHLFGVQGISKLLVPIKAYICFIQKLYRALIHTIMNKSKIKSNPKPPKNGIL